MENWNPFYIALAQGETSMISIFLKEERVDINAINREGENALLMATKEGNLAVIEFLVEDTDIDITNCNNDGNNALHLAIINNHTDIFDYLVKPLILRIKCFNDEGWNCLHLAVYYKNLHIVKYLIEEIKLPPYEYTLINQYSPRDIAMAFGNHEICKYLTLHSYKNSKILLGINDDDIDSSLTDDYSHTQELDIIGDIQAI
jgi:ankyrin repeat protein